MEKESTEKKKEEEDSKLGIRSIHYLKRNHRDLTETSRLITFKSPSYENGKRKSFIPLNESESSDDTSSDEDLEDGSSYFIKSKNFFNAKDNDSSYEYMITSNRVLHDEEEDDEGDDDEDSSIDHHKRVLVDFNSMMSSTQDLWGIFGKAIGKRKKKRKSTSIQKMIGSSGKKAAFEIEEDRLTIIASTFLQDYIHTRKCILPMNPDYISNMHILMHRIKFSSLWEYFILPTATISLFLASFLEGDNFNPDETRSVTLLVLCTAYAVLVFVTDIYIFTFLQKPDYTNNRMKMNSKPNNEEREEEEEMHQDSYTMPLNDTPYLDLNESFQQPKSRMNDWTLPLLLFFFGLSVETFLFIQNTNDQWKCIWLGLCKPVVLFYVSHHARDALDALITAGPVVIKVIVLEVFLILIFSIMASFLFDDVPNMDPQPFETLSSSFIALFELSTTVVSPSLYIPIYAENPISALFFISFLVLSVLYLHSLVLSVIFQSYSQAITDIRQRKKDNKERSLLTAFKTLMKLRQNKKTLSNNNNNNNREKGKKKENRNSAGKLPNDVIYMRTVKKTIMLVRPHYTSSKIDRLAEMLDPLSTGFVNYDSFRKKLPKALSTSLRTPRRLPEFVIQFQQFVTCVNIIYVMSLSCSITKIYFFYTNTHFAIVAGFVITIIAIVDIGMRVSSLKKFDMTFDMLGSIAACISLYAIVSHRFQHVNTGSLTSSSLPSSDNEVLAIATQKEHQKVLDLLVVGRVIDMFRAMEFVDMFRAIMRRTGEVLPLLSGPFILVASSIHIFCFVGMARWGGHIHVGKIPNIELDYDYNNFNTYSGGLLTMFQLLVVNDWNQIAKVYLSVDSELFVYSFFTCAIIFNVSILLNVLMAFFIGAFVTKPKNPFAASIREKIDTLTVENEITRSHHSESSFGLLSSFRDEDSNNTNKQKQAQQVVATDDDMNMSKSVDSMSEFNISVRPCFDTFMKTVTGFGDDEDIVAKEVSEVLELFEKLAPGREKVGYLCSCYKSMNRYGNRRFQNIMNIFMSDEEMHVMIGQMSQQIQEKKQHNTKLIQGKNQQEENDSTSNTNVTEKILERGDIKAQLTASILREGSTVILFVARRIP